MIYHLLSTHAPSFQSGLTGGSFSCGLPLGVSSSLSNGSPLELKHIRALRHTSVLFQNGTTLSSSPVSRVPLHVLTLSWPAYWRKLDTSGSVPQLLLGAPHYTCSTIVDEFSIRYTPTCAQQVTHRVHLCPLVWTTRHDHSSLLSMLHIEKMVFPLHTRHFSGEVHLCSTSREHRHVLQPAATLPKRNMGTTCEVFHNRQPPVTNRHACRVSASVAHFCHPWLENEQ